MTVPRAADAAASPAAGRQPAPGAAGAPRPEPPRRRSCACSRPVQAVAGSLLMLSPDGLVEHRGADDEEDLALLFVRLL